MVAYLVGQENDSSLVILCQVPWNTLRRGDLCIRNLLGYVGWDQHLWKAGRKETGLGSSNRGLSRSPEELWSELKVIAS